MNAPVKPEAAEPATMLALANTTPVAVLTDAEKFDAFYADIRKEVDAFVPDLSTATGRKAIASLAYKVARTKTAIDEAGKLLNEDARRQMAVVDEARRKIRDRLDNLRDEVRKPLDEWERAEAERAARVERVLAELERAALILADDTSETLDARLAQVVETYISDEEFRDAAPIARAKQQAAVEALSAGIERLRREEADRAELQRLREDSERRQREEEARVAAETAAREAAEREAREAEARRAQEERDRQHAEALAREEEEREARREEARAAAEATARANEEAAAARREADAARAETERLQREAAAREAEERRQKEAEERRAANKARARKVNAAAVAALRGEVPDLGQDLAMQIVLAIALRKIPGVSINY